MLSVIRRTVAAAALVGATAMTAEAQLAFGPVKIEEVRIDFLSLVNISDAGTLIGVGAPSTSSGIYATLMPSSIALGIYLNDKIALEPSFSYFVVSPENGDSETAISISLAVPYYLAGDRGKTGLFVAPVISTTSVTDQDGRTDMGIDVGYKKAMNSMVSWTFAGMYRTGDTFQDETVLGARAGVSIFLRNNP
jgi:hypothetical protein